MSTLWLLFLLPAQSPTVRVLAPDLPRHDGPATGVAYSPDGKRIATCGDDGTVRIWDADNNRPVARWLAHPAGVTEIAYGSDGATLATSGKGGTVSLWDIDTGEEIQRFVGHRCDITGLVWLPARSLLLSASVDGQFHSWDTATGEPLRQGAAPDRCRALAMAPDGRSFALGHSSGVSVYQTDDLQLLHSWEHPISKQIEDLCYSPSGASLAVGTAGYPTLHHPKTGQSLTRIPADRVGSGPLRFSPDGSLFAKSSGITVQLWTTGTDWTSSHVGRHLPRIEALAFRPDSKVLATVGVDGSLRQWDVTTGHYLGDPAGHLSSATQMNFSPDGRELTTLAMRDQVIRWDVATGRVRSSWRLPISPIFEALGGSRVLTASADGSLRLHDAASGEVVRQWERPLNPHASLALSPDDRFALVRLPVGARIERTLWRLDGPEPVAVRNWDSRSVVGIDRFSPDSSRVILPQQGEPPLVVDSVSGRSRAWNAESVRGNPGLLWYSPDSRLLFGRVEKQLHLWEVATGLPRAVVEPPPTLQFWRAVLSPENRFAYLTDEKGGLHRIDVWTAEKEFWPGLTADVSSLAISPDGRTLAIGTQTGPIRLLDVGAVLPAPVRVGRSPAEVWRLCVALADDPTAIPRLIEARPTTVTVLRERMRPVAPPVERIGRLLRELDDDDFDIRDRAQEELSRLGQRIAPEIDTALSGKPSPEFRRRLEAIRSRMAIRIIDPRTVGELRALEVLERLGAVDVITTLASGDGDAELTRQAKSALRRLKEMRP